MYFIVGLKHVSRRQLSSDVDQDALMFGSYFKIEPYTHITEHLLYHFIRIKNNLWNGEDGWESVERPQRFCDLCTRNILGDEFHYLLECYQKFYLRHMNTLKFKKMSSTENLQLFKQFSRFISIVLSYL